MKDGNTWMANMKLGWVIGSQMELVAQNPERFVCTIYLRLSQIWPPIRAAQINWQLFR